LLSAYTDSAVTDKPSVEDNLVGWMLVGALSLLYGALIKAVADRYLGKRPTVFGAWSHVLRRLTPCLLTSTAAWLAVAIGLV
jgi:hypothetical protein